MTEFVCEKCGACCAFAKCELLDANNLCKNYVNRPDICKFNKVFQTLHDTIGMTDEQFITLTTSCCKILRSVRKEVLSWDGSQEHYQQ